MPTSTKSCTFCMNWSKFRRCVTARWSNVIQISYMRQLPAARGGLRGTAGRSQSSAMNHLHSRPARVADRPAVEALLAACDLPTGGLDSALDGFVVVED